MIERLLTRFADALDEEIEIIEDSIRRWNRTLGGRDNDTIVLKTLQYVSRALRRALSKDWTR